MSTIAGINWNDLGRLKHKQASIGMIFMDRIKAQTGINWNDFGVMSKDRDQLE